MSSIDCSVGLLSLPRVRAGLLALAGMCLAVAAASAQTPARQDRALPSPVTAPAPPPLPGLRTGTATPDRPLYAPMVFEDEIAVLVAAAEETTLSAQMVGRILSVAVGLGDTVAKGAKLIEFDCSEQQAQLQAAQAEYRGLRETHLAKLKLQALGAAGELEVTVAATAAEKAKGQVDVRESQMTYCSVASPFAGRVARIRVKSSESVSMGQGLIELVNSTELKAQMFVPANFARFLKPGAPFQVKIEGGQTYRARVARINSRVEGVSQQLEVEGRFEGTPPGLLPGMVGTAVFPGRGGAR